jgi:hypothetical protein
MDYSRVPGKRSRSWKIGVDSSFPALSDIRCYNRAQDDLDPVRMWILHDFGRCGVSTRVWSVQQTIISPVKGIAGSGKGDRNRFTNPKMKRGTAWRGGFGTLVIRKGGGQRARLPGTSTGARSRDLRLGIRPRLRAPAGCAAREWHPRSRFGLAIRPASVAALQGARDSHHSRVPLGLKRIREDGDCLVTRG